MLPSTGCERRIFTNTENVGCVCKYCKDLYHCKIDVFRNLLESACLSVHMSVCVSMYIPNHKMFKLSKIKVFAEVKLNVNQVISYVCDRIEKSVEKGENRKKCGKRREYCLFAFSPFPNMFLSGFLL